MKTSRLSWLGAAICLLLAPNSLISQNRYTPEVERRAEELLSKMTEEEKLAYIGGQNSMYIRPIERLGIPAIKMSDGPQGLGTHGQSIAYPSTVLLTATWNTALAYEYGSALGRDCRAQGVNVVLGPAVNIYRAPMNGRNFEYMGEDPYLASQMVTGYIRGVQDQGAMATVKHFAANNSDYDRHNTDSRIDERTLHEIYFPAFKAAVQDGEVGAVMTSYNLLNGTYTTECPWLLRDVLRGQWGFKGVIMSDWGSTHHALPAVKGGLDLEMPNAAHMSPENLEKFLAAGEIAMDEIDEKVRNILRTIIAFGFLDRPQHDPILKTCPPENIQTALDVAREGIVLLKNDNILPIDPVNINDIVVVGKNSQGYVFGGGSGKVTPPDKVSMFEGIKNAGGLRGINVEHLSPADFMEPLVYTSEKGRERGFKAEYFNNMNLGGTPEGTRSETFIDYAWNNGPHIGEIGNDKFSARWSGYVIPQRSGEYEFTLGGDDGFRLFIDNVLVIDQWENGAYRSSRFTQRLDKGGIYPIRVEYYQDGGDASVNLAWKEKNYRNTHYLDRLNKADLVIACFGFNNQSEGEGFDRTFELPETERIMITNVLESTTSVVGVLNSGGSVEMAQWETGLSALIWAGYAGQQGGTAVADVLFGEVNPSGRLPMTWEKRWADNPVYNTYYPKDGTKKVAYEEGIFVGYRGYDKLGREVRYPFGYGLSYTTFELSGMKARVGRKGNVEVSFTLKNTGERAGAQVVQLYVNKGSEYVENPEKELRGFTKIYLEPGKSKKAIIELPADAFSWYDTARGQFVTKPGTYGIMLGFSSRDIKQSRRVGIE